MNSLQRSMSSGGLGGAGGLFGGGGTAGGTGGGLFGGSGGATRTSGGLFGGGGTTAAGGTSSGGLFGGTGAGGTTGAGSGIFGGGSTSNPPSGGLFGGAQTTTTTGGGLFSAPATTGGGGLFGGGGGTTATSGGLFGGGPSSGGSGGLFGPSGGTTGATGGLFGGANASTATTGGLFGQASGMNQQGQQQLNPFAHRDFFTGTLILPPTGQPGAQAPLNSQKSFLDKLGPFTVTTLASNQFGRKLNNQGQQKKEKEVNDQADLDKKEKEAFQAELDKLRPIYYNHRIENMNFSSNPLYNKQITSMPEDVQKGILAIDKKIADSSVKLSELKKATADLKNGLKHKLLEMVDERFTKIKALNIKFKMIRQDIGMLNEYVTFFLGIGRDLMLYYESLNIDKVYCLQIPSAALDRITAFVSAYVKSLKQNLDELMVTKEKDPELEATNYVGEFGEVFEHLLSFLLVVINRAVELRAAISRVKARFGLHEQVSYHEPTEHMNEERLDAVNTNIDVLTKMLV